MKVKYLVIIVLFFQFGCKKMLDEKRNKSSVIPSTLKDCQALLDYHTFMNEKDATAGEISADDYYLPDAIYNSLPFDHHKSQYIWEKKGSFPAASGDWPSLYRTIYYANTVLETLDVIVVPVKEIAEWESIRGQALVFRAKSFLQAAWQWAPAYDKATAASDPGIPLRLSSDFNEKSVRSSLEASYRQVITDLREAVRLLPEHSAFKSRPAKIAAYAFLARTFLSMREYSKAELYADSALSMNNALIDYNNLNPAAASPFTPLNDEVIHESRGGDYVPLIKDFARVDSVLYNSYSDADLRKTFFFQKNQDGSHSFKGSYEGGYPLFSGPSTAEMMLISSEAAARRGDFEKSLQLLNLLLEKRYKAGSFVSVKATSTNELLSIVLKERRKELVMRFLRWIDLKRLNKEGAGIVVRRMINGRDYILLPNDKRYALPLPDDVIQLTGMQQNP